MAKLSTDDLLDAFKEMSLIELSEFVKQFEDTFGVTAAAPVAVAAAPGAAAPGTPAEPEEEQEISGVRAQITEEPVAGPARECPGLGEMHRPEVMPHQALDQKVPIFGESTPQGP